MTIGKRQNNDRCFRFLYMQIINEHSINPKVLWSFRALIIDKCPHYVFRIIRYSKKYINLKIAVRYLWWKLSIHVPWLAYFVYTCILIDSGTFALCQYRFTSCSLIKIGRSLLCDALFSQRVPFMIKRMKSNTDHGFRSYTICGQYVMLPTCTGCINACEINCW